MLSLDWLLCVVKPCRTRITIKQSWLALVTIWSLSVLMASPLFVWRKLRTRQWRDLVEVWCCEREYRRNQPPPEHSDYLAHFSLSNLKPFITGSHPVHEVLLGPHHVLPHLPANLHHDHSASNHLGPDGQVRGETTPLLQLNSEQPLVVNQHEISAPDRQDPLHLPSHLYYLLDSTPVHHHLQAFPYRTYPIALVL